ncbi:MAG: hypothetical protein V2I63_02740, partial [Pseudomonadales bacterium]|nr:hypothetical protein [Pseudomonadales bacterium]
PTTARDPGGAGGHRLIREGATLIRGLDDLLEELLLPPGAVTEDGPGIHAPGSASAADCRAGPDSDSAEETRADPVLASLDPAGTDLETLLRRTALDARTLAVRLVELELDGRILRDGDRVTPTS